MKGKKVLSLFLVMLLMLSSLAVLPAGAAEDEATVILAANAYDIDSASGNSKSYDFENGQTFSNNGSASYTFTPGKTGWYRVGVYNEGGRTFSPTSDTEVNTEKTYYTLNSSGEYEAVAAPEAKEPSGYYESALANDSTTFGVTAKIGEESRSRSGFGVFRTVTWWYYSEVGAYYNNVGGFKLTANEEVTLELSFTLTDISKSVQIRDIKVQYMPDIEVSAAGDTKIVAASYADGVIPRADQMMYGVFDQGDAPEGTISADWKGTVVGSTESTLLYNINVSEAGYYSLSSLTSDQWNHCTVYDNGEQVMVNKFAGVTQNGSLTEPVWSQLGVMYLTAGQHELKIVHYGGLYIFGFKLAPYHKTIDATEKTYVQFYKDFVAGGYRDDEAGNSWGEPYHLSRSAAGVLNELTDGYLIGNNSWMTYVVEAEEAGYYTLSMVLGNAANLSIDVQVNDDTEKTMTWKASGITDFSTVTPTRPGITTVGQYGYAHESEMGTIYLNKGLNTVKIKGGSYYLYSWSLARANLNAVSAAGSEDIPTLNYSGYYIGTESNPSDAVVLHNTYWFTYLLNVAEAGTYKLTTIGPDSTNAVLDKAYGNVENLTTGETYFTAGKQIVNKSKEPYTVGNIYLEKGRNELKFTFAENSSTYWYSFKLERVRIDVPAEGITLNASAAQQHYAKSNGEDEFNQTDGNGKNMVVARDGHWFTYSLNVAEAGLYTLVTVRPADGQGIGEGIGILTNETTGETYLTGKLLSADIGDYTVGKIYLQAGTNDLKFAFTSASTYWYSFRLKSVPAEKLYNTPAGGTKAEATAVADGTMSVSVTMPASCKTESLAVIFAIYQDGRLYKAVSEPTAAVSADTPIELSIENVATEAGSTYSYRVFYWNDMTSLQPLY